jgi:hypothetical protein
LLDVRQSIGVVIGIDHLRLADDGHGTASVN